MTEWCTVSKQSLAICLFSPPLSSGSGLVWENRGDRQHAKPRLCQKVHPGLLLRGEAEPALWRVSYSFWSGPLRTHAKVPLPSNPVLQFFLLFPLQAYHLLHYSPPSISPFTPLSLSFLFSSLPSLVISSALSWGIIHLCSVFRCGKIGIRLINTSYKVLSLIFLLLSKANIWNKVPQTSQRPLPSPLSHISAFLVLKRPD